MKNWIKIAALALLAASYGCAKVDMAEAPQKAVTFTVGTYSPQTRAEGDPESIYTKLGITSFSSQAFLHGEGVEGAQRFFGTDANPVETVTFNTTDTEWYPSHDYFWPKSSESYVDFFSWYGVTPTLTYTKGASKYAATLAWNNFEVTSSTDYLLWADAAWHYKANVETYQFDGVSDGVPTLFHHALSQVTFVGKQKAVTSDTRNVSWEVTVTGLSLSDVVKKGTLSLSTTEIDGTAAGTSAWTTEGWAADASAEKVALTPSGTLSAVMSTSADTDLLPWTTVLPQAVTEDMELTVKFTVTTTYTVGSTTKTVAEDVTKTVALTGFDGEITAWEPGKRIKYTIIIDPDAKLLKLIPAETDWITESEYTITVE